VDDPLVRDYVERLETVALIHTARILGNRPELLNNRSELRGELLKSLRHFEGFESIVTLQQTGSRSEFRISAAAAQIYLEHRSELRIRQAA
jgi:hypothetical protein